MTIQELKKHLNIDDQCISQCNPLHVVSENKMTFRLDLTKVQNEKFWAVDVDKCMLNNSRDARCDHAFIRLKDGETEVGFYYVELKNNRVRKAYDQIVTTITKHFKNPAKENNYGFIVSSSVPSGTEAQILRKEFIRKYGADLIIKNNIIKHTPQ
jgi:hypothetical protein